MWCFVSIKNPVAIFFGKIFPGDIHIVAKCHQYISKLMTVPGGRPGSYGSFTDGFGGIGDHVIFGYFIDSANSIALRACPLRGVGREILGIEHALVFWILAGA